MSTLQELQTKARELKQAREARLAVYRDNANKDVSMTPSERAEYIAHWRQALTKQYAPQFAAIKAEVETYADRTKAQAAKARPQFDADSPTALVRTEQAWRNVVLPQLEKGRSLRAALRNADADAVLGAERFAPAWLQANSAGPSGLAGTDLAVKGGRMTANDRETDTTAVTKAITARFIELADPEGAAALASASTLDAVLPAFSRFVDHLDTGAGDPLAASVGLHYAMNQSAGSDDSEPADDAA
ncbi:hypothetical protein KKP62_02605 [Rhodococcus sp. GOMB7]|uniref:hypothetical protein n=1 Tax=Rhodococcus sp. GOMB7 TaxID=2839033 RepID=UPI001C003EF2|nr:hypothetical protein [Rhodococcus sp. GOMB7]MBT9293660.1 hypothetical protein [Rhodococcus sp. GOMB7]MBT9293855.1 hypothetical protein [Rhodococcus sp. GOMB7]